MSLSKFRCWSRVGKLENEKRTEMGLLYGEIDFLVNYLEFHSNEWDDFELFGAVIKLALVDLIVWYQFSPFQGW